MVLLRKEISYIAFLSIFIFVVKQYTFKDNVAIHYVLLFNISNWSSQEVLGFQWSQGHFVE